jgi:pyrimidine operon attenuation protein/uracil phosphoribosyltransferase
VAVFPLAQIHSSGVQFAVQFAAKERLYFEGAVKVVEADIRFYRDAEENAERALIASNDVG